jgi:hypothetical protein
LPHTKKQPSSFDALLAEEKSPEVVSAKIIMWHTIPQIGLSQRGAFERNRTLIVWKNPDGRV